MSCLAPELPPVPARTLDFEGCVNFRDIGGYRTANGRMVAWRTLFRADGLNKLTDADIVLMTDLGLATVIDLRTLVEAEQRGSFPVDRVPVSYVGLPLTDVLPATEDLPDWGEAAYVATRYGAMVSEGGHMLTSAIQTLATGTALPAVMHCSAGKDRTGVLSALILAFLGVPDETIVDDYALSAAAMGLLLERLKAEYPDAVEEVERYAPAVLHVVPETMEQFLAELKVQYGTYELLAESLGVTEAVAMLRTTVLVDA